MPGTRRTVASMTLVLAVGGRDSIWLLTDRRLSRRLANGRYEPVRADAIKCTILETLDGVSLLAYAGLGQTPRRTQPSDWMSAVLRGYGGLTIEQALGLLSDAANKELPRYITGAPGGHTIVAPVMLHASCYDLFSIENALETSPRSHFYRFTRWRAHPEASWAPPISVAGSGSSYLQGNPGWERLLLRIVRANDRGQVSDQYVAQCLAGLNMAVHLGVGDGTRWTAFPCRVAGSTRLTSFGWRSTVFQWQSARGGLHHDP
jgi:hypothetical protein